MRSCKKGGMVGGLRRTGVEDGRVSDSTREIQEGTERGGGKRGESKERGGERGSEGKMVKGDEGQGE